jgi:hypothetical protein
MQEAEAALLFTTHGRMVRNYGGVAPSMKSVRRLIPVVPVRSPFVLYQELV